MAAYLAPPSQCPQIGDEAGDWPHDGVAILVSPHGSIRFVSVHQGEAKGVLQVVSRRGFGAQVANVYVVPEMRRRGVASALLRLALERFPKLRYSEDRSADGRAWVSAVTGEPLRSQDMDPGQDLSRT